MRARNAYSYNTQSEIRKSRGYGARDSAFWPGAENKRLRSVRGNSIMISANKKEDRETVRF